MPTKWTLIAVDNLLVWVPPARRQWQTIDWKAQTETFSKVVDISGQPQCVNNGVRVISSGDIRRLPLTVFIGLGSSPIKHSKGLSLVRHIFLSINSTHTHLTLVIVLHGQSALLFHTYFLHRSPHLPFCRNTVSFTAFSHLLENHSLKRKASTACFHLLSRFLHHQLHGLQSRYFSGLQQDSTETLFA